MKESGERSVNCSSAKKPENTFTITEDLTKIATELRSEPDELQSVDVYLTLRTRFLPFSYSEFDEPGALPSGGASSQPGHINGRTCNWRHSGTQTPSRQRRMVCICGENDLQNLSWVSLRTQRLVAVPLLVSESRPQGVTRQELCASKAAVERLACTPSWWQTASVPG